MTIPPKLSEHLHLITVSDIAVRYLNEFGYEAFECASEDEARDRAAEWIAQRKSDRDLLQRNILSYSDSTSGRYKAGKAGAFRCGVNHISW